MDDMLAHCPTNNKTIVDNLIIAWSKINSPIYKKILIMISGGSDSDTMLDLIWRIDIGDKCEYVWLDTGLEYNATKDHLRYLETKYNIEIKTYRAKKAIPTTCKENGQPFMSKYVSEMMQRLQRHNFQWEDETFEELYKKYPKCKIALQWWCDTNKSIFFNISRNKYLKEFIVRNHPTFKISNKCCQYAKKDVSHQCIKDGNYDLVVLGIRRAEGGVRTSAYKNCFDEGDHNDNYRPLFWYVNEDKKEYDDFYCVENSDCYSVYGLERTGCAGCPFGKNYNFELSVLEKYENKLFKAVSNIFGDSYKYTEQYYEFRKMMNENGE